jgi:pimeloyl-ACP methyl ester carboxylesterase
MTNTVVLLHGWLDGPEVWKPVCAALEERGLATLTVRLAPSGADARCARGAVLDAYAAQVADEIARREISEFVIVGHSMGAQVAELVAASSTNCVGLCLLVPAPLGGIDLPDALAQTLRDRLSDRDPESVAAGKRRLSRNISADAVDALVACTSATPQEMAAEGLMAWRTGHVDGDGASRFAGPVAVIGSGDLLFTEELLRQQTLPRFSQGRLSILPDSGHWPQLEEPASVAALIAAFISAVGGTPDV